MLREFLNPRGWKPSEDSKFFLDAEQINQLCDVAEQILQGEPSVLRLKGTFALQSGCDLPVVAQSHASSFKHLAAWGCSLLLRYSLPVAKALECTIISACHHTAQGCNSDMLVSVGNMSHPHKHPGPTTALHNGDTIFVYSHD